jgi:hypothetical protein
MAGLRADACGSFVSLLQPTFDDGPGLEATCPGGRAEGMNAAVWEPQSGMGTARHTVDTLV